jgi:hypothetical protein
MHHPGRLLVAKFSQLTAIAACGCFHQADS